MSEVFYLIFEKWCWDCSAVGIVGLYVMMLLINIRGDTNYYLSVSIPAVRANEPHRHTPIDLRVCLVLSPCTRQVCLCKR